MFSYRHSLNGREAAAHLEGWTSEHYMSSAQLYEETYTEVIGWLQDLSSYLYYSHLYRHSVLRQEELQPGFASEDEENCVYSWYSGFKLKPLNLISGGLLTVHLQVWNNVLIVPFKTRYFHSAYNHNHKKQTDEAFSWGVDGQIPSRRRLDLDFSL